MSQHRRSAASTRKPGKPGKPGKRKPRRSVRAFLLTTVIAAIFVAGGARYVIGQFSVQAANPLADALTAIPASKQGTQLAHQRQHMILMAAATKSFKVVGKPKVAKLPPPPSSGGTGTTGGGTVYAPIPSPGTAQHIAYSLLPSFGFSTSQFGCLNNIWTRESGWSVTAANASGAYGIPQALPGSKMATAGPNWQTDATTQIKWGLGYIKERYGSPCNAWAFWQGHSWY